uniref:Scavenger receptor class F member 1 n=1 Tax=Ornithorhynchus anatinus TaxID=9258 RepID=F7EM56_ORNAN
MEESGVWVEGRGSCGPGVGEARGSGPRWRRAGVARRAVWQEATRTGHPGRGTWREEPPEVEIFWVRTPAACLAPSALSLPQPPGLPSEPVCCPGWRQEGRECTAAICDGEDACGAEEVCVRPGLCRCKPGYFGAQCNSRCPGQYWGPDCRRSCPCHPHGQCHPASGQCSCHSDRWGGLCQFPCSCGAHGSCDPLSGACRCQPGWWGSACRRPCQCNPAGGLCHAALGSCLCQPGWWGRRCSFRCPCHGSPCSPTTGRCACRPGWWGPDCRDPCDCGHGRCHPDSGHCACHPGYRGLDCRQPCPPGSFGLQCRDSCGHCQKSQACFPDTGACPACEPGWNGTRCDEPCPAGTFGERCEHSCPPCRQGETCQPDSGHCQHCDPGQTGPRCEDPCPLGTYGENCSSVCPACEEGACDPVSGECVCNPGFWGPSCNTTCPSGFHGDNCSLPCGCSAGTCHPVSGDCELSKSRAPLIVGVLVPLSLLLLSIASCVCCCCWALRQDPKDRSAGDGSTVSRVKLQVQGALTSLATALPCGSLSGQKLPRVTVSHHDPEIPFNHSFIEPPSAGWASDDSFSSDPDSEDDKPDYCVPPREEPPGPEESPFPHPDDASTPFAIPRTSSLAQAKRPSVSFAEGTKFGPQDSRASGEPPSPTKKPKRLSRLAQPGAEGLGAEGPEGPEGRPEDQESPGAASPRDVASGRRRPLAGGRTVAQRVEAIEGGSREAAGSVTTIYMLAGTPRGGEGPVQAVLRRFGSFQRGQAEARPKPKASIPKPPRRSLARDKGSPAPAQGPDAPRYEELPAASALEPAGSAPSPEQAAGVACGGGPEREPQDLMEEKKEEEEEEPQYENVAPNLAPADP